MSVQRHLVLLFLLLVAIPVFADEGMWTFDNPPLEQLADRYDFAPTEEWLDHIRLASVRLGDGGSGSFVSPNGLVLTNFHVAHGQLQKLSTRKNNLVTDGFRAWTRTDEKKCPDLEINVLISTENVTDRVLKATEGLADKASLDARQAVLAEIEKESLDATELHSEVVSLYYGGEYWLYRYQRYTDVRLVFAPEEDAAYFGGDDDNFTFPRYCLDMALFRVYENNRPIKSPAHLVLNPDGAKTGDLVFVSGHPGGTDRLLTMAQLATQRDFTFPRMEERIGMMISAAEEYAARGPEQARQVGGMLMGMNNGRKSGMGSWQGLMDENVWSKKETDEKDFRGKVAADPNLEEKYGHAWTMVEEAEAKRVVRIDDLSWRRMPSFRLGRIAQSIVRYVEEINKPDAERLEGYHDAQLKRMEFRLFSPAPIYPELEEFFTLKSLERMVENLGEDDEFVLIALGGMTPAERAAQLATSGLIDPEQRRKLVDGGSKAVAASKDPMLVLARELDPILREQTEWIESNITSVMAEAGELLGAARFAVYGKTMYPDATFSLRLSYGKVAGYPMNGTLAPSHTTFYGLYDRADSFDREPPFAPTQRFDARRSRIDLSRPMNVATTNDIIGGNSGSPLIDREGHLVGLIFDGNIESLAGNYVYDDTANRAISVHAAAIETVLRDLYDAGSLADEMMGR
jgi:hypothetical protein